MNNVLDLYEHNLEAYKKVKEAFESRDVVGIVHATGTGKSYIALQLAYDNRNKNVMYIVPSNSILEHIKHIIELNSNLDLERDFSNLEFVTYQSFVNMSRKDIEKIDTDLIILDEFHHIGAPVWGSRIQTLLDTHKDSKVFGMTAYTVRDRGTSYERDMANPDGDELFSNNIVSVYDLCDAMIDGVLPKPIYKSAYIKLLDMAKDLEVKLEKMDPSSEEYKRYIKIIEDAKKRVHQDSLGLVVKKNVRPNGKYIYFCPPSSVNGVNDIESIKKEALKWFRDVSDEENIIFYSSTSEMGFEGEKNRLAFYNDESLDGKNVDGKLRVMFAINQYNEGVHAPNIDGVIMGRGTSSDIVYFEQLGRALSVRGDTHNRFNEYMGYSLDELRELCNSKLISIGDNDSKEDLVQKLIAPTVIDLANNLDYIRYLENNLRDKIKKRRTKKYDSYCSSNYFITDASFYLDIENSDIYEELKYVLDRLTMNWDDKYNIAVNYYNTFGNLLVPINYKTINGVDESDNGVQLGRWLHTQRKLYRDGKIKADRKEKLDSIGMIWDVSRDYDRRWEEKYKLAKDYYEKHGNLIIPRGYKVYCDYLKKEVFLKTWLYYQRLYYKDGSLSLERKKKLEALGIIWDISEEREIVWNKTFELAKNYYEKYHNLLIPASFKSFNGVDKASNGVRLGSWIRDQRRKYYSGKLSKEQIKKLELIGMQWDYSQDLAGDWEEMYEYAKKYYEKNGNLSIIKSYKFLDDESNTISLGSWIEYQRRLYKEEKLSSDKIKKLETIGMKWLGSLVYDKQWNNAYELAKKYFEYYGNLMIKQSFRTNNGVEEDPNGYQLGTWISTQRTYFKKGKLTDEQLNKLESIGMVWDASIDFNDKWERIYNLAENYYNYYGDLLIPFKFKTSNGIDVDDNGVALGSWISNQRSAFKKNKLSEERIEKLELIGMKWSAVISIDEMWNNAYELACNYYNYYGDLLIKQSFKTFNGIEEDPNGFSLGGWISNQRLFYKKEKLLEDRRIRLEQIGMVWDASKKQNKKVNF